MKRIKELELQIKIMANTIDTQERIIEGLSEYYHKPMLVGEANSKKWNKK